MMQKRRMPEIDIAKGIAIILVVLGHLVQYRGYTWSVIFSFHMPLFFLTSGYCTSEHSLDTPFRTYLKHSFFSLIIPAVLCRAALWVFAGGGIELYITPRLEWFISSLIFARILLWFIHRLYRKIADASMKFVFTAGMVVLFTYLPEWLYDAGLHNMPEWLPIPLDCGCIALAFILIGFYVRNALNVQFDYQTLNKQKLFLLSIMGLCVLFLIKWNQYVNVADVRLGRSDLFFYFAACFWTVVICYFSSWIAAKENSLQKILILIGKDSLIIYMGHRILFAALTKAINLVTGWSIKPMFTFNGFLVLGYFAVTMLILVPVCLLRAKAPKIVSNAVLIALLLCCALVGRGIIFPKAEVSNVPVAREEMVDFEGAGTVISPYLIHTAEDLVALEKAVNSGTSYENCYFKQTADIDLAQIDNWVPIGVFGSGNYFEGVYNGNGFVLTNLNIDRTDNCGLFGMLGGTVKNLGIESGTIKGSCIGSITSHGTEDGSAKIINCYSKATLIASGRAGGIADNFCGEIYFCWSDVQLTASGGTGGIVSYNANRIEYCYAIGQTPVPETMTGIKNGVREIGLDDKQGALVSGYEISFGAGKSRSVLPFQKLAVPSLNEEQVQLEYVTVQLPLYICGLLWDYKLETLLCVAAIILTVRYRRSKVQADS